MKKIDLKSFVIGGLSGALVLMALGAASPSPGPIGRYQVSAGATRAYVVDTTTGQIWESVIPPNAPNIEPEFGKPKAAPASRE